MYYLFFGLPPNRVLSSIYGSVNRLIESIYFQNTTYLLEARLPENKSVYFGSNYTHGICRSRSFLIHKKLGFSPDPKIKDLSSTQIHRISKSVESVSFIVANDLKRLNLLGKQRLIATKPYGGLRRKQGFPIRCYGPAPMLKQPKETVSRSCFGKLGNCTIYN
jgi:small subunit ribosomal protein S13